MILVIRYSLPPEEIQALRNGLKKKWEAVNKVYQEITHINKVDTIGLKRKFKFNNLVLFIFWKKERRM